MVCVLLLVDHFDQFQPPSVNHDPARSSPSCHPVPAAELSNTKDFVRPSCTLMYDVFCTVVTESHVSSLWCTVIHILSTCLCCCDTL